MNGRFNRHGKFYVYIVECSDGSYYSGYTNNLKTRLIRHNKGFASKYTRTRLPVKLVWSKEYRYFKKAFLEEKRIKGLTRKQKEKLINGFGHMKKIANQHRMLKQPKILSPHSDSTFLMMKPVF